MKSVDVDTTTRREHHAPLHGALSSGPAEQDAHLRATAIVGAVARLSLGWTFLWPFLDKLFGLGHETPSGKGWIDGGSPTLGFLSKAAKGPLEGTANSIAGQAWTNWLFMAGLLAVGVALLLGVTMRLAVAAGSLLLLMMWAVVLPPANNPFMDDHLLYIMLLGLLLLIGAGRTFGLGRRWEALPVVQSHPFLR